MTFAFSQRLQGAIVALFADVAPDTLGQAVWPGLANNFRTGLGLALHEAIRSTGAPVLSKQYCVL